MRDAARRGVGRAAVMGVVLGVLAIGAANASGAEAASGAAATAPRASANTQRLMVYQVWELTLRYAGAVTNPTWDLSIEVQLRSPTGKARNVGGFYDGAAEA